MQRDSPFVQVYTTNEDTFVRIRQLVYAGGDDGETTPNESQDGVMMSLIQFRSLMFHLRALDAQFTQRVEMNSTVKEESNNENNDNIKSIGTKRTWNECENEEHSPSHDAVDIAGGDVVNEIATHAWAELDSILASFAPSQTSNDVVECIPIKLEPRDDALNDVAYIPAPIEPDVPELIAMSQATVRDELAIAFAEEVVALLPSIVNDACSGCRNGIDRNTNAQQHDACTLPRKKRIDMFTETAVFLANEATVHKKLAVRLKSRNDVLFNEDMLCDDRNVLVTKKKWMNKVKKHALDM